MLGLPAGVLVRVPINPQPWFTKSCRTTVGTSFADLKNDGLLNNPSQGHLFVLTPLPIAGVREARAASLHATLLVKNRHYTHDPGSGFRGQWRFWGGRSP